MATNETPGAEQPKQLGVDVRVYPVQNDRGSGNTLAFASATIGGCFAIKDIRVMNGKNGPFVAMPCVKGRDGKFYDLCFPVTKEMREALHGAVLGEYQRATEKTSVRGALVEAAKEAKARPAPEAARSADKGAR